MMEWSVMLISFLDCHNVITSVKEVIFSLASVCMTVGALKMTDMKLQDMKLTDQVAGHEIAGHENGGPNSKA